MTFKNPKQPLCRWCGGRIAKQTERVWVWENQPSFHADHYVVGTLRSIADCIQHTNLQVVSVRYTSNEYGNTAKKNREVSSFCTWDGESYVDEFFCNGTHAKQFAYAAARKDLAMPAYNEAIEKRKVS